MGAIGVLEWVDRWITGILMWDSLCGGGAFCRVGNVVFMVCIVIGFVVLLVGGYSCIATR